MKRFTAILVAWALLVGALFAADKYWIGVAQDVAQVDTITFAGTWAAGDTVSVTCNYQTVEVTGGASLDTTAEYAIALAEAINSTTHDETSLQSDMTINFGGQEFPEFRDFKATVSGSVVYLTSTIPGVPFDVSVGETAAGTATLLSDGTGESVLATGKNWWNEAVNWEGGTLPSNDDDIFIQDGNVSILYGLSGAESGLLKDLDVNIHPSYTGNIGLPKRNPRGYNEYRFRYLALLNTATTGEFTHTIGATGDPAPVRGMINLYPGANNGNVSSIIVHSASNLNIIGGRILDVTVHSGNVRIAEQNNIDLTTLASVTQTGGNLLIGPVGNWASNSTSTFTGGVANIQALYTTAPYVTVDVTDTKIAWANSHITTLSIRDNANFTYDGALITTTNVYEDGVLNANNNAATLTNVAVYKGAGYNDPKGKFTLTNGIDFVSTQPAEMKLFKVKTNQNWTPSAITP